MMRLGRLLLQTCGEKEPHPEAVAEMLRQISGGLEGAGHLIRQGNAGCVMASPAAA